MPGGGSLRKQLALAAAVLVAVALVPIARAATSSVAKGQVGGPPTLNVGPPEEGMQTTPALVIGRGQNYDGPVEIAAFGYKPPPGSGLGDKQVCIVVEYPKTDDIEFEVCGLPTQKVEITSQQQQVAPKSSRYTEAGGFVESDVASVRVTFHRKGKKKHAKVTLAKITPDLQEKLGLAKDLGYWDTKVPGLVNFKSFRAKAFDANGKLLGTAKHLTVPTVFRPQR